MELLAKKQKHKKNRFSLFKQKLDKKCLVSPLPFDDNELHHYLNNLYSCEIKGFKEELSRVEKQLAHQAVSWIYKYEIIKMIKSQIITEKKL